MMVELMKDQLGNYLIKEDRKDAAMINENSKNRDKYIQIRKTNLHKMEPIPVCKIPN